MVMVRPTLILVTLLALTGVAFADAPEARKHFDRGMKAYNLLDFKGALVEFQRAYVELPDPAFLFNIAQAQRQLGQYEAASKSYHMYLANQPNAPNREQVLKFIEQMDKAAASAHAQPATPPPTQAEPPAVVAAAPPPAARSPEVKWYASPLGWSLVGGGVVIIAVSGGLLGVAMSERDKALSGIRDLRQALPATSFVARARELGTPVARWVAASSGRACGRRSAFPYVCREGRGRSSAQW